MDSVPPPLPRPTLPDWIFRSVGFLALVGIAFALPNFPAVELDSSWRMALGKFFQEGRQFGTEVVFTYGPLGFVMGKTYWGGQWASLIGWQAAQAVVFSLIIFWQGLRLTGYARFFFFAFFACLGLSYQDATHQIIIALAGLELIRRSDKAWGWSSLALVALLAVLSLVKFTNLLLALVLILLAGGLELWSHRRASALRVPLLFLGCFLLGWRLCGQHLGNIPAYLHSSWEISQGYQDAMGYSCPPAQLYFGLTVLALLVGYLVLNLLTCPDRVRGAALTLGASAFIYLNWKHGFIRADGHQAGFYFVALAVAVSSPFLLEDGPRCRLAKGLLLGTLGLVALIGIEQPLPGAVRGAIGGAQNRLLETIPFALGQSNTRGLYDARLQTERDAIELLKVKAVIKHSSVDVLGFLQAVAMLNGFNYQPRPVFQGYSAYTPYLSRLNYDFYASDRAPDYVLFKLQTLDSRLSTMDDPHSLRLLIQRYTYVLTDLGFTLWKRKPGPFDAAAFEPKPIRSVVTQPGVKVDLADLAGENIWVEIDYNFSLLGRMRRFFFKPPLVQLRITDDKGVESVHRLPQPIGQAGFMLNPVVDDLLEFMRAAGGTPKRRARSIVIDTAPQDRDCLQDEIKISFSSMPHSDAGTTFFKETDKALFHMFMDAPISYTALNPPNAEVIDKRTVMIMHAPSEMIFEVPAGATMIQGAFGFLPGAYSNGGRTNGAVFFVIWDGGSGEQSILLERYLDPVNKLGDRGLQKFSLHLPKSTGRVTCRINPGPFGEFAFDWTGWTGIEFK